MNILLVYPEFPDTFWSFKHALRFVHKRASSPPLGLVTVASMLPDEWNKRLVDMNIRKLTAADIDWADMVMVSAMVVQRKSAQEVIQRSKSAGKVVVAGGPLFTQEWEAFPEVDHFVLNEGELTLPGFLQDLKDGHPQPLYRSDDYADIHQSPVPMWELVDFRWYDSLGIQYSRGCPFNCDFCNVTALLGHRPRTKTAAQIIAELDKMYSLGWRRNVFFVDDNFIGNKRQLKEEILPALIEWRKGKSGFQFITEASINLADDEELMQMMNEAGFVSIFVGIETPEENGLAECHKTQNTRRDLVESVHRLQHYGLEVMGGFIVGFDSDGPNIFRRQIEFIQKSGIVTAMVGILQAPLGTRLYARLKEEGRLLANMTGDNADGSTNIIPHMPIQELTEGYKQLVQEIYSPKIYYQRVKTFLINYNPPKVIMPIRMTEISAFFQSIWQLGIVGPDRREYWKLVLWTLFRYPQKFAKAITYAIYGFHFRRVSELNRS